MSKNSEFIKPKFQMLMAFLKPIPNSLLTLVTAALVLTITFVVVSESHYRNVVEGVKSVQQARDKLDMVERLQTMLVNAETGQRGYLLTNDVSYLEPLAIAKSELPRLQQQLAQAFINRPETQSQVDRLVTVIFNKFVEIETTVALAKQGNREEAIKLIVQNKGQELMDEARKNVLEITDMVGVEIAKSREKQAREIFVSRLGMLAIAALNLILLALVIYYFMQDLQRRQVLTALRESENERLSKLVADRTLELNELSTHLQSSGERERAALARDLHDELGGILTSAKMDLEWLRARAGHIPDGVERLEQFSKLIDEAVTIKRRVIENLRPSLLDNLGLSAALEWYISENCSKGGLKCTLNLAEELGAISPDASIALFRIVQEGTTNMLRHSKAKTFTASLELDEKHIHLILHDDGEGLPATFNPAKLSHGLSGIRQRARSLGGEAVWASTPGKGTTITVTIPRDTHETQLSAAA